MEINKNASNKKNLVCLNDDYEKYVNKLISTLRKLNKSLE